MPDVFLSYAREDESYAGRMAAALEARGWSVWWDRRLPTGEDFRSFIERQLNDARCIVVLWSGASVRSRFVQDEAEEGLRDGRLLPVCIERGVRPPMGFRGKQVEDLSDWDGRTRHDGFEKLVASLAAIAPPIATMILTLERDPFSTDSYSPIASGPGDAGNTDRQPYRVTLEGGGRSRFCEDVVSIVNHSTLRHVLRQIAGMLNGSTATELDAVHAVGGIGRILGEDILQTLTWRLEDAAARASANNHLKLNVPPELMPYPWELMQHRSGWLCEDFAIGRTSLRAGAPQTRMSGPLRVLVVANPTSEQRPRPDATREALAVVECLKMVGANTDGLVDFRAERDAIIEQSLRCSQLRTLFRRGHYDIVHFSGYATFSRERRHANAWMLSDGPLTALEIRNTWSVTDEQPWLVYTNVIDAGLDGPQDHHDVGAFGLAHAFVEGGVTACVVPSWRIDDSVGAELAGIFYRQLLEARQTVGASLRTAKAQAKRTYCDPARQATEPGAAGDKALAPIVVLSWASLVLYGDPLSDIRQRLALPEPAPADPDGRHEP